uniref:Neurturin n=1 Tax=Cyclopterus lumpus TaxID=8103 RepID=A0A8C3APY2_CYCLU
MKLWKGATFAFMLCGAALSILLVKNTINPVSPLYFPPVSMMLQSFTEGELQHVVETLLDRKRRKRLGENQARRTKRARRPKPCSLRELELTVSELGLGYESDETLMLRYCSGKCLAHRHNYDITMEHMMRIGFRKKGRKDKVSNRPCCRPTAFEKDFSFLDNKSRYHTIQNVSAKNCGCA